MTNTDFGWAIDLFDGELARLGRTHSTRKSYTRIINLLAEEVRDKPVTEVTLDDCRRFVNRWIDSSKSTLAGNVSIVKVFFRFLADNNVIAASPAEKLRRPPKPRPEDLNVVRVSEDDVKKMFDAIETWQELLCLSVLCYMGCRRRAASMLRWEKVDLEAGTAQFHEKGGKWITKPIPDELAAILRAAKEHPEVPSEYNDYVIPNFKPSRVTRRERKDAIIYDTVKRIADRAGVNSHAHALRAAFAVKYLESHVGDIEALKELMGHTRIDTTQRYLQELNKVKAMERVRDLSWGSTNTFMPAPEGSLIRGSEFEPYAEEAHTGFEPVFSRNSVGAVIQHKLATLRGVNS